MNSMLAVGLMSGTSMDGVDAALIETDGEHMVNPRDFISRPYTSDERDALRAAMARALNMDAPGGDPLIDAASAIVDGCHIRAVEALLDKAGLSAAAIGIIGYHGQTVAHRPDRGWTWQIGDGQALADALGVAVVDDFRSADVAGGGQGAPLVPAYHAARLTDVREPVMVLNLGGVGNVTFIGATGKLLAFDTGPANALIDDWVREQLGKARDSGGALAASGQVHEDLLKRMLDHPWFDEAPPKSLDRNDFSADAVRGLSPADGAATLTAFTAATVARAIGHCPSRPAAIHVAGGGRHNATLMKMLEERTGAAVRPVDDLGWNGDATEAEAFAYLAARYLSGKPTSFPETTGVHAPVSGGRLSRPRQMQKRGMAS